MVTEQAFYVIIDRGISEPGHDREVIDGLNYIEKRFLFQLISTVKLSGAKSYDTKMVMHTGTRTSDVNFSREFKNPSYTAHKHVVIDKCKYKKGQINKSG